MRRRYTTKVHRRDTKLVTERENNARDADDCENADRWKNDCRLKEKQNSGRKKPCNPGRRHESFASRIDRRVSEGRRGNRDHGYGPRVWKLSRFATSPLRSRREERSSEGTLLLGCSKDSSMALGGTEHESFVQSRRRWERN